MACLIAVIQQTFEHWLLPAFKSREPTQCTKPIALGEDGIRVSLLLFIQASKSALVMTWS